MIISPIPYGSGAFIVHSMLEKYLENYKIVSCSPKRSYFPPLLYPLGRSLNPSIVHVPLDYAWFHAHSDVPMIATLHNYVLDQAFQSYGSTLQRLHWKTDLRLFHKLGVARADILIAVSQFTASLATQDLDIKKPIKVIYNGVDESQFTPKKRSVGKEIKVLFSGNLTRRKGAHLLLPIIDRLDKNIKIYYTSGLRETSQLVNHPRLCALGNIPHNKMPELYQSMDILLFPTVREGHSIAVLEAMASGLPVVASNVASLPEQIIHGQGGFLCELGDINSFVHAIQTLADDMSLCQQMGQFNRAEVEQRFRLATTLAAYQVLFDEVS